MAGYMEGKSYKKSCNFVRLGHMKKKLEKSPAIL